MTMEIKNILKQYIIDDLHLEDVSAEDIDEQAPLFGEGLGLDSLDAVELVVLLQKRFGVLIKDMEQAKEVFASLDRLAEFIGQNKAAN